jgi:hypothetical protein
MPMPQLNNTLLPMREYEYGSKFPPTIMSQKDLQKYLTNKTQATKPRLLQQEAKESLATTEVKKPKRIPSPLPPHLAYPRTWRDMRVAGINLSDAGAVQIALARAGYRTFISSIVFTVDGDTSITIGFGTMGSSGPMDFGDTDEPRGIAMNFADSPAPCGLGGAILISDGSGVSVHGFATYYQEQDESPI